MMICKNLTLLILYVCLSFVGGHVNRLDGSDFVNSESSSSNGIRANRHRTGKLHPHKGRDLQVGNDTVVQFDVYDAILDVKVASLTNGTVLNLTSLGIACPTKLNIEAVVLGSTRPGSVKLSMDDVCSYEKIENTQPYTFCGNLRTNYFTCSKLSLGAHSMQAVVYSGESATGSILGSSSVSFTIVNGVPNPTTCSIPKLKERWEKWEPYPIPIAEGQGARVGNYFFVISGFSRSFSRVTPEVYGYDTTNCTATWRRFDDVPVPAFSHAAHATDGLLMYLCGSYVGGSPGVDSDICLRFSPTSPSGSQWLRLPNMPISRGGGGMVHNKATNSLMFAAGATRRNGTTTDFQDAYEFDLTTQVWTTRPFIPYAANHVSQVTATYQDKQHHYIMGGQVRQDESNGNQKYNYEWDAVNKVWIKRADLVRARGHTSSSTVAYGCGFLTMGGSINNGFFRAQTSEISYYAIDTDTWTKIGNLPEAINTPVCDIVRFGGGGDDWVYCQTGKLTGKFSWRRRISQN